MCLSSPIQRCTRCTHWALLNRSHFIITLQILVQEMFCNLSFFAHAVPSLALSVFTPPPWRPPRCRPRGFPPGVNTGGVGSYIYEKEPSAVTQPWTFVFLSLIPLLYTTLTINHSIICRPPFFSPARFLSFLFILTRCQQIFYFFCTMRNDFKNYLDMCVFLLQERAHIEHSPHDCCT